MNKTLTQNMNAERELVRGIATGTRKGNCNGNSEHELATGTRNTNLQRELGTRTCNGNSEHELATGTRNMNF